MMSVTVTPAMTALITDPKGDYAARPKFDTREPSLYLIRNSKKIATV
jgi:hypothetical protein